MYKQRFLHRDRLLRAVTRDGNYRISIAKTTNLVRTARKKHNLSLLASILLGRALTGTILMAANLKGEERIQLKLEGNGPIGAVITEATGHGEVRGYVVHPEAELDLLNDDKLGDGIGIGVLSVSKILYNKARPVTGTVALARGNVNEDLAHYFLQSEQIPSAVSIDVGLDDQGEISEAGGVLVQAMPGATRDQTEQLEENIRTMPLLSKQFASGYLGEVLKTVSGNIDVKELARYPIDFFCRCSRARFKNSLALVNPEELLAMQGKTEELVCHYCGERYEITPEELKEIIQKAMVRLN
ncbi:MAG: Hsp33 family molecular chaperone HslO [Balneolales bacterium]